MTVKEPKRGFPKVPKPGKNKEWKVGRKALKEIRLYQKSTKLCIPKLPFAW